MYFWYIWQAYSSGITKKELTNVEILEQTGSLNQKKEESQQTPRLKSLPIFFSSSKKC